MEELKQPTPGQAPAGKPLGREPEIHVMPSKYAGAAVRASIPKSQSMSQGQVQVPVAKTALPAGAVAAGKAEGPAKGLIIGGVALVLIVGGVLAAFFWPREKATIVAPPVNVPAEVVTPQPPAVEEVATTTPEEATSTVALVPPAPPKNSIDSDADGLSDVEEQEIYRTDAANADTDNDGYLDGGEAFYLYNPAGVAPVTLRDSGLVYTYDSPGGGYSVLVPLRWRQTVTAGGESFSGATGEAVAVSVEANPELMPLVDWYLERNPSSSRGDILEFVNRAGLSGIKSSDGLTAYIASGDKVFVFSYDLGGGDEVTYRRTFEMMTNGVRALAAAAPEGAAQAVATSTPAATSTEPAVASPATSTEPMATSTPEGSGSATGTPSGQ